MAKVEEKRGREEAKTAPQPAKSEAKSDAPVAAEQPRRRILLCLETCVVCLGPGTTTVFGSDIITDQAHVNAVAHDPHFKVFEGTLEEIEKFKAEHAAAVARVKREGAALGLMVERHGEFVPRRR